MGDRGGVKNIRAMFESKHEETSPPSRGRSPAAGSEGVRSNSSRPVSKIRASFVAVEGAGGMVGLRKLSNTMLSEDGEVDAKRPDITSEPRDKPSFNDGGDSGASVKKLLRETKNGLGASATNGSAKGAPDHTQGKAPEEANKERGEGLGAVLKGSPFEPLPSEKSVSKSIGKQAEKTKSMDAVSKTSPAKATAKPSGGNAPAFKAMSESKPLQQRPTEISTTGSSKPSKQNTVPAPTKSLKTPTTPKAGTPKEKKPVGSGKVVAKASAPRQSAATSTATAKAPERKSSRSSLATQKEENKNTIQKPSASGTVGAKRPAKTSSTPEDASPAASTKKSVQISPGGFKKPPPKSPTRPVRLPASATAQTAASAAKLGHQPISNSPNRTGVAGASHKSSAAKAQSSSSRVSVAGVRPKASRPSLGAPTNGHDRPSSRASNVSKPPDGDFLSRMMRPTTASASKTQDKPHEKVEIKAPSVKHAATPKPKRKSELPAKVEKKEHEEGPLAEHDDMVAHESHQVSDKGSKAVPEDSSSAHPEPVVNESGAEIKAKVSQPEADAEGTKSTDNFEGQTLKTVEADSSGDVQESKEVTEQPEEHIQEPEEIAEQPSEVAEESEEHHEEPEETEESEVAEDPENVAKEPEKHPQVPEEDTHKSESTIEKPQTTAEPNTEANLEKPETSAKDIDAVVESSSQEPEKDVEPVPEPSKKDIEPATKEPTQLIESEGKVDDHGEEVTEKTDKAFSEHHTGSTKEEASSEASGIISTDISELD